MGDTQRIRRLPVTHETADPALHGRTHQLGVAKLQNSRRCHLAEREGETDVSKTVNINASTSIKLHTKLPDKERLIERKILRALVGNLELDPAEAILAAQEAPSTRLPACQSRSRILRGETVLQRQQPNAGCQLREKDLKDLATRLFLLLGMVKKIGHRG